MVFEESEAQAILRMDVDERVAKVDEFQNQIVAYRNLMYVVSLNTGWISYSTGLVQFALLSILKVNGSQNSIFMTVINLPWSFKPLFGFISDKLAIFGYR